MSVKTLCVVTYYSVFEQLGELMGEWTLNQGFRIDSVFKRNFVETPCQNQIVTLKKGGR